MDLGQFQGLLVALKTDLAYEQQYMELLRANPAVVVHGLLDILLAGGHADAQSMALVHLGVVPRIVASPDPFNEQFQRELQAKIGTLLSSRAGDKYSLDQLTNATNQFYRLFGGPENPLWVGFLGEIFQVINPEQPVLSAVVLDLINQLISDGSYPDALNPAVGHIAGQIMANVVQVNPILVLACFRLVYRKYRTPESCMIVHTYMHHISSASAEFLPELLIDLCNANISFVEPMLEQWLVSLVEMIKCVTDKTLEYALRLLFKIIGCFAPLLIENGKADVFGVVMAMSTEILAASNVVPSFDGDYWSECELNTPTIVIDGLRDLYHNNVWAEMLSNLLMSVTDPLLEAAPNYQVAIMLIYIHVVKDMIDQPWVQDLLVKFLQLVGSETPLVRFFAMVAVKKTLKYGAESPVDMEWDFAAICGVVGTIIGGDPVPEIKAMAINTAGTLMECWGKECAPALGAMLSVSFPLFGDGDEKNKIAILRIMHEVLKTADAPVEMKQQVCGFMVTILGVRDGSVNTKVFLTCLHSFVLIGRELAEFDEILGNCLMFVFSQDLSCLTYKERDIINKIVRDLLTLPDGKFMAFLQQIMEFLVGNLVKPMEEVVVDIDECVFNTSEYVVFSTDISKKQATCYYRTQMHEIGELMSTFTEIARINVQILMPAMSAIVPVVMRWMNSRCSDGFVYEYVFSFLNEILESGVLDLTNGEIQSFIGEALSCTCDLLGIISDLTVGMETLWRLMEAMMTINPENPPVVMRVLFCLLLVNQRMFEAEQEELKKSDYLETEISDIHEYQKACGIAMISMFRCCAPLLSRVFPQIVASMQQFPSPIFMIMVWTGFITFTPGVDAEVTQRVFGELYQHLAGADFQVRDVALSCLSVILHHRADLAGVVPEVMQKLCECLTAAGDSHVYIHRFAIPLVLTAIRLTEGRVDTTPLLQVFHTITEPRPKFIIQAFYPEHVLEDFCALISSKKEFFAYMQANPDRLAFVSDALSRICTNDGQRATLAQLLAA